MGDAYIVRHGGSMGDKSVVIVTGPAGSKVTLTKGGRTKQALEKNGTWTFRNIENGTWTLKADLGSDHTDQTINVSQFDVYRVNFGYVFLVNTIKFASGMVKGRDYEVFRDNGSVIPASSYGSEKNWNLEIYTTQTLNFTKQGKIDIFMVGAGGNGGGPNYATGGAGGRTRTEKQYVVKSGSMKVVIGAAPGGSSSFAGYSVLGGESGGENKPANGGSGGGGCGNGNRGGSNGGNGIGDNAGKGQGWSTKAFGTGKLYAGGGGGYSDAGNNGGAGGGAAGGAPPKNAAPNTGGGGGGGGGWEGGRGGSGIVIIRNAR